MFDLGYPAPEPGSFPVQIALAKESGSQPGTLNQTASLLTLYKYTKKKYLIFCSCLGFLCYFSSAPTKVIFLWNRNNRSKRWGRPRQLRNENNEGEMYNPGSKGFGADVDC